MTALDTAGTAISVDIVTAMTDPGPARSGRELFSPQVREYLESVFSANPHPDSLVKYKLHSLLKLDMQQINDWFHNRRQKERKRKVKEQQDQESIPASELGKRVRHLSPHLQLPVASGVGFDNMQTMQHATNAMAIATGPLHRPTMTPSNDVCGVLPLPPPNALGSTALGSTPLGSTASGSAVAELRTSSLSFSTASEQPTSSGEDVSRRHARAGQHPVHVPPSQTAMQEQRGASELVSAPLPLQFPQGPTSALSHLATTAATSPADQFALPGMLSHPNTAAFPTYAVGNPSTPAKATGEAHASQQRTQQRIKATKPSADGDLRFTIEDMPLVSALVGLQEVTCRETFGSSATQSSGEAYYLFEQITSLDSVAAESSAGGTCKRNRSRHQHFWRNSDKVPAADRLYVPSKEAAAALKGGPIVPGRRELPASERSNVWTVALTASGCIDYLNRKISPLGVRIIRALLARAPTSAQAASDVPAVQGGHPLRSDRAHAGHKLHQQHRPYQFDHASTSDTIGLAAVQPLSVAAAYPAVGPGPTETVHQWAPPHPPWSGSTAGESGGAGSRGGYMSLQVPNRIGGFLSRGDHDGTRSTPSSRIQISSAQPLTLSGSTSTHRESRQLGCLPPPVGPSMSPAVKPSLLPLSISEHATPASPRTARSDSAADSPSEPGKEQGVGKRTLMSSIGTAMPVESPSSTRPPLMLLPRPNALESVPGQDSKGGAESSSPRQSPHGGMSARARANSRRPPLPADASAGHSGVLQQGVIEKAKQVLIKPPSQLAQPPNSPSPQRQPSPRQLPPASLQLSKDAFELRMVPQGSTKVETETMQDRQTPPVPRSTADDTIRQPLKSQVGESPVEAYCRMVKQLGFVLPPTPTDDGKGASSMAKLSAAAAAAAAAHPGAAEVQSSHSDTGPATGSHHHRQSSRDIIEAAQQLLRHTGMLPTTSTLQGNRSASPGSTATARTTPDLGTKSSPGMWQDSNFPGEMRPQGKMPPRGSSPAGRTPDREHVHVQGGTFHGKTSRQNSMPPPARSPAGTASDGGSVLVQGGSLHSRAPQVDSMPPTSSLPTPGSWPMQASLPPQGSMAQWGRMPSPTIAALPAVPTLSGPCLMEASDVKESNPPHTDQRPSPNATSAAQRHDSLAEISQSLPAGKSGLPEDCHNSGGMLSAEESSSPSISSTPGHQDDSDASRRDEAYRTTRTFLGLPAKG